MGHDPQPGEIVLHTALLSEPSTAGSWATENSVLYPIIESFRFEDEDEDKDENEDQGQLLLTVCMLKSVTVMA